jgi:SAM-dependent methyltransferase
MKEMVDLNELARYLAKVDRTFGIQELLSLPADRAAVIRYYTESEAGYALLHSRDGSVHMTLSSADTDGKPDSLGQARSVEQQAKALEARNVVELGSGKGFNVSYVAQQMPSVNVVGMDMTALHVSIAKKKHAHLSNLTFLMGDFHACPFPANRCDLLFEVEAVCHSQDPCRVFAEAFSALRSGGRFVLFDGFRDANFATHPKDVQTAVELVERTMAVREMPPLEEWLSLARYTGFRVLSTRDLSKAIMPNLERFQILARGFYKYQALTWTLRNFLPPALSKNSVAGLLMPFTFQAGAHKYYEIILEKP